MKPLMFAIVSNGICQFVGLATTIKCMKTLLDYVEYIPDTKADTLF